jgi:predicted Zn-dependent protease
LRLHPNYLGGRVALGRAYFEKKQYAEAAAEMQKVAKAAPDNIIAHKVLGQIAGRRNDLPAAEKAFRMVLLLDPRTRGPTVITNLAEALAPAPAPLPGAAQIPGVAARAAAGSTIHRRQHSLPFSVADSPRTLPVFNTPFGKGIPGD